MFTRPARLKEYWTRNVLLISCLLLLWLLISLLPFALAYVPTERTVLGWPLPFALTAFGIPLVYLFIIGFYAVVMARRDAVLMKDMSTTSDQNLTQDQSHDE